MYASMYVTGSFLGLTTPTLESQQSADMSDIAEVYENEHGMLEDGDGGSFREVMDGLGAQELFEK